MSIELPNTLLPPNGHNPRYRVPAGSAQSELVVRGSVFIATVDHSPSVDHAKVLVSQIAEAHSDASHNAWAFQITRGPQALVGSSDDGEPGGTAGRPMLAVVQGSGLCEIAAVVTRYFGGTKLGAGGLVRAYSNAVRQVLNELSTVELVLHHVARLVVDYGLYGNLKYLLPRLGVQMRDERFTDRAILEVAVPYDRLDELSNLLRDMTNGQTVLSEALTRDALWLRVSGSP